MDETLLSSFFYERRSHRTQITERVRSKGHKYERHVIVYGNEGGIVSFLRPLAHDLIAFCRELVDDDKLAILTMATADYAIPMIGKMKFNINPDRIYTREDLHINAPMFKNSNNILVDNESYQYHIQGSVNKVNFLHGLPEKKYVRIEPFHANHKISDKESYLDVLKAEILQAIKN